MTQIYSISATAATARRIENTNIVRVNIVPATGDSYEIQVASWLDDAAKDFAKLIRAMLSEDETLFSRRRRIVSKLEEKVVELDPKVLYVADEEYEDSEGNKGTRKVFISGKTVGVKTVNLENKAKSSFDNLAKRAVKATLTVVDGKFELKKEEPKSNSRSKKNA